MTLTEFITIEAKELAEFAAWWEKEHRDNAEHFPKDMAPGEWWEQFMMWCETRRE